MIVINMFSSANKVAGQGVGAVYTELMGLLKHDFSNEFEVNVNRYTRSDISHYHTIDPKFYLSTFSKTGSQDWLCPLCAEYTGCESEVAASGAVDA